MCRPHVLDLLVTEILLGSSIFAGHLGLNREVHGLAIAEEPQAHQEVKQGEIVLSSGYFANGHAQQLETWLLPILYKQPAAILFRKSEHTENIAKSTQCLFEEHNIPLILIPARTRWSDMIRQIFRYIDGTRRSNDPGWKRPITEAFLTGRGIFTFTRVAAKELNLAIALTDQHKNVIITQLPDGANYSSNVKLDDFTHSYPIVQDEETLGYLWAQPIEPHQVADTNALFFVSALISAGYERFLRISDKAYYLRAKSLLNDIKRNGERELSTIDSDQTMHGDGYFVLIKIRGNAFFEDMDQTAKTEWFKDLRRWLDRRDRLGIVVPWNSNILFLTHEFQEHSLNECAHNWIYALKEDVFRHHGLEIEAVGISNKIKYAGDYSIAASQAEAALNASLRTTDKPATPIVTYPSLGILGILHQSESARLFEHFGKYYFEVLKSEDDRNGLALLDSVKVFLESNGNFKLAAEKLFIHRNTLRYRLQKVNELLGIDLTTIHGIATIYLAIELEKIRHGMNK